MPQRELDLVNICETKEMRVHTSNASQPTINSAVVEQTTEFYYLGCIVTGEPGTTEDIHDQIIKARSLWSAA